MLKAHGRRLYVSQYRAQSSINCLYNKILFHRQKIVTHANHTFYFSPKSVDTAWVHN